MVANGIVVSQLCYMIQVWGGCEGYLLNSLQFIMNRAARYVTRSTAYTSTRRLLSACNWLSVRMVVSWYFTRQSYWCTRWLSPVFLDICTISFPPDSPTRQGRQPMATSGTSSIRDPLWLWTALHIGDSSITTWSLQVWGPAFPWALLRQNSRNGSLTMWTSARNFEEYVPLKLHFEVFIYPNNYPSTYGTLFSWKKSLFVNLMLEGNKTN